MKILTSIFLFLAILVPSGLSAHFVEGEAEEHEIQVYFFGRDDCGVCAKQKEFLEGFVTDEHFAYEYLDVVDDEHASELFNQVTEKHNLSKVTPLTVIGETVIQGFNGPDTTGARIIAAVDANRDGDIYTIEDHLLRAPIQSVVQGVGCDENGELCGTTAPDTLFDLPILGVVDLKSFSLVTLSVVLGTIDGFNPCAMWVLITFLVLLSQAGSKRRMVVMAGIFILAEAIMYNLILNVWYKTWDFVALDQIVTPLVGGVALGGGLFFLYRWYKNRTVALVCDISSIDRQTKTVNKIKALINQPLTLGTLGAIILIAFSVNIIEFACSIGIPQAYTKILDLNMLSFIERQFYILIYTAGYMLDDLVVFGLAIWGFSKLEAHGHKFAQLSLLLGGALMVILGVILVFNPNLLVL